MKETEMIPNWFLVGGAGEGLLTQKTLPRKIHIYRRKQQ